MFSFYLHNQFKKVFASKVVFRGNLLLTPPYNEKKCSERIQVQVSHINLVPGQKIWYEVAVCV